MAYTNLTRSCINSNMCKALLCARREFKVEAVPIATISQRGHYIYLLAMRPELTLKGYRDKLKLFPGGFALRNDALLTNRSNNGRSSEAKEVTALGGSASIQMDLDSLRAADIYHAGT